MDRLILLVGLRFKLGLRALARARERAFGLALMVPGLLFGSVLGCVLVYFGLGSLEWREPASVLPVVSAVSTGLGLFWALSPLLSGVAFVEAHDVSRLVHYPIPLPTLVISSLLSNLAQPMVLSQIPLFFAFAAAVSSSGLLFIPALAGALLSFTFILAVSHAAGLLLHGVSRNRTLQDLALFATLALGVMVGFVPLLVVIGPPKGFSALVQRLVASDVFALSPFAWGMRAGVLGGRGEAPGFALWGGLAVAAILVTLAVSTGLTRRIELGEFDLGPAPQSRGRARLFLPGTLGALLEKEFRATWREPAFKASLVVSLLGPFFLAFALTRGMGERFSGGLVLALASMVGISGFGSNAFGQERRGVALLFSFPVSRGRILVAKNLTALCFRLPGLLGLGLVGLFVVPTVFLPAAFTIAFVTLLLCLGVDNYMSVLFPVAAPAPGRNPYGGTAAGGRGLGAAALASGLLVLALLASSPFVLLAWLPFLLEEWRLWLLSLPLALAGAAGVYAMLVAGAASLLSKREPEILERILTEA